MTRAVSNSAAPRAGANHPSSSSPPDPLGQPRQRGRARRPIGGGGPPRTNLALNCSDAGRTGEARDLNPQPSDP
jgi:hypothetical protein